ncbi:hypothetical protein BC936DRAFT_137127 [Jimgerdemannia flammicorona]|uniref:Uncharacterized protein n=1 Tax=Jimgerdemannia flammicorona TaxID=994334 RepID=A0A433CY07_9FUNG|nr:hypothetical protein BC936DRAFT_137127 [Jimgerdemannia flammicorona]
MDEPEWPRTCRLIVSKSPLTIAIPAIPFLTSAILWLIVLNSSVSLRLTDDKLCLKNDFPYSSRALRRSFGLSFNTCSSMLTVESSSLFLGKSYVSERPRSLIDLSTLTSWGKGNNWSPVACCVIGRDNGVEIVVFDGFTLERLPILDCLIRLIDCLKHKHFISGGFLVHEEFYGDRLMIRVLCIFALLEGVDTNAHYSHSLVLGE